MNVFFTILGALLNVVLVILAAPLAEGLLRRVTARLQSRQGPPLLQPYFDLLKLLGKEDIESGQMPVMQRVAAYLSLGSILAVACFIPMGLPAPMEGWGDVIVLVYLLTLAGVCTLLAGLAAGSTYSLLGMSREMMGMLLLEPLLAVTLIIGSLRTHSLSLGVVLDGSIYAGGVSCSSLLILGVMLLAFQAFVQRAPFDITEAETELMSGPLLEYSGPKLALLQCARMAKLILYSGIVVTLFVPWGNHLFFPIGWLVFWLKVFTIVLVVTLLAATHARYRIDQAIRYYAGMLSAALAALALASYGL